MTCIIKQYCRPGIFVQMLRQATATIFILAFLVQSFSGQFIRIDYYLNTAAFAKNCENKARPKMHSNGKCQMMKKMQQEEKKNQQVPERRPEKKNEVLSSKSFFCSVNINSILNGNTWFSKNDPSAIGPAPAVSYPPPDPTQTAFI